MEAIAHPPPAPQPPVPVPQIDQDALWAEIHDRLGSWGLIGTSHLAEALAASSSLPEFHSRLQDRGCRLDLAKGRTLMYVTVHCGWVVLGPSPTVQELWLTLARWGEVLPLFGKTSGAAFRFWRCATGKRLDAGTRALLRPLLVAMGEVAVIETMCALIEDQPTASAAQLVAKLVAAAPPACRPRQTQG